MNIYCSATKFTLMNQFLLKKGGWSKNINIKPTAMYSDNNLKFEGTLTSQI